MLVQNLNPSPNHQLKFDYPNIKNAPKKSGGYVITAFNNTTIYIGQSTDLSRRMKEHLDGRQMEQHTPVGVAFWFYYQLENELNLNKLERGWIQQYQIASKGNLPPLNTATPPV